MAVTVVACQTQKKAISDNKEYVPYAKFKNDTLNYLKANFEENKNFYIGKPVKTILDDLEIPVLTSRRSGSMKDRNISELSLIFISWVELDKRTEHDLYIYFQESIPFSELDVLIKDKREKYDDPVARMAWTELDAEFYGSRIIKDIQVVKFEARE